MRPISFETMLMFVLPQFVLRGFSTFVVRDIIRLLLLKSNSKGVIQKTKKAAKLWKRITGLCFWHMKSAQKGLVRFFVSYCVVLVVTFGIPYLLAVPSCIDTRFEFVSAYTIRVSLAMDLIALMPMGIYESILQRRKKMR